MQKIIECVPNFSEGRNMDKIKEITDAIESTQDVKLIHVDPGFATNRTVVTFVGTPDGVKEAAFKAVEKAAEVIDMEKHQGEHPRMGASDVFPFIPVSGVSMKDCVRISREVGERIGRELGIPIYLYESSANVPKRKSLAYIRSGEYEGFREKIYEKDWKPDFGPQEFNPRAGCTTMGAREFLIAYNVNLDSTDKEKAQVISQRIRESGTVKRDDDGKIVRDENGKAIRVPGKLKHVRAVGWFIEEYRKAQISINLTNFKETELHRVYDTCVEVAEDIGTAVTGSEIIGLVPLEALLEAGRHYLVRQNRCPGVPEDELISVVIESMGLNDVQDFDPDKKIIEFKIRDPRPLVEMDVSSFIKEVSKDSAAPGGGSVAALSCALGAALASMVGNLTANSIGKASLADPLVEELNTNTVVLQETIKKLSFAVDEDSTAFNSVMAAYKLPRKTEEEKNIRKRAIEDAYKLATVVPFNVMKRCVEILPIVRFMADNGRADAMSDTAVAALMAQAGIKGAAFNVDINLKSISDLTFVAEMYERTNSYVEYADKMIEEIMVIAVTKIAT